MRCKKFEKWISDDLDGRLSLEKKAKLDTHLANCAACRSYEIRLRRIDEGTRSLEMPQPGGGYWESSIERLRAVLTAERDSRPALRKQYPAFLPLSRLARAGAFFVLALVTGLSLLLLRPGVRPLFEYLPLSSEDALGRLYENIGPNTDLEVDFEREIQASIAEHAGERPAEVKLLLAASSDFVESLSDEEIQVLETELGYHSNL
jgi:hypothetical protein